MSKDVVLQARGIRKSFRQNDEEISVLLGVDFSVAAGEQVAVVGPSGSGKSSLLHILAGLDSADHGSVHVAGQDMGAARKWALFISSITYWRNFPRLKMLPYRSGC